MLRFNNRSANLMETIYDNLLTIQRTNSKIEISRDKDLIVNCNVTLESKVLVKFFQFSQLIKVKPNMTGVYS